MSFSGSVRRRMLIGAVLAALLLLALTLLVKLDVPPLDRVDKALGRGPELFTVDHPWLLGFLLLVQTLFTTLPMSLYTAITAVALAWRGYRRTGVWVVVVMTGASLTTYAMKVLLHRRRPVWPDPVTTLTSYSFPSGHATGIAAAAGVIVVLTFLLVRRATARRVLVGVALALALLVGLDRIFLGVHNPSDVVAGYAVGALWVLVGARLVDPAPKVRAKEALAAGLPSTKQLAVIVNPIKVEDAEGFHAMVERSATSAGWTATAWFETTEDDPGRSMAEQAAIDGAELVLVCGGDGTVRTVCAELAGTGVAVGVIPAGTGNLLARNLGLPLFFQAAVEVALSGQDRAIDLVSVSGDGIPEGEHFMVMAGMGVDAVIMEGLNERIKAHVGWLAYFLSGLKHMMWPAVRLEISVDGGEWTPHRARTVVVGNVGYLQGGIPLLPDAAIDDGVLDVVVVHPRRLLSWVRVVARLLSRGRRTDTTLDRMTGRRVSIRAAGEVPRQLDGDPIGAGREVHCECLQGKVLIRVPR